MESKRRVPHLQSHHRIKFLEKQVGDAIKVRNILIAAGKVTNNEFDAAEDLVRTLAPDNPPTGEPK